MDEFKTWRDKMNILTIIVAFAIFGMIEALRFYFKRYMENTKNKIKAELNKEISSRNSKIEELVTKNKSYELCNVSFDETKKVLMNMIDEYISFIFRNEINMPHNIKNKDKPTTWDNVFMIPTNKRQQEHYDELETLVTTNMSDSFLERLRVFYKDSYINHFIKDYIVTEYNARILDTIEEGKKFRDLCRKNAEEFARVVQEESYKKTANKNEKINRYLNFFGFDAPLETDVEKIIEDPSVIDIEKRDAMKLFRGRYLLNKQYYDSFKPYIHEIEDTVKDIETIRQPDDKFVTYLASEYGWDRKVLTAPEEIEVEKLEIVEVCLRHGLDPVAIDLFGEYNSVGPYVYKDSHGVDVSMHGKRLNPIFYISETYNGDYSSAAEVAYSETKDIFV